MAERIKGITIQFNGDTSSLDKALKSIQTESKSVDSELRKVNNALKFNPKNTELLQQKFVLLGQKIDITERQLKEFKNAEAQMRAQGVSKQSSEWMEVRRRIIETESKLKHFNAELQKVKYANITNLGESFKTAGQKMRTAGMYASGAAAGMVIAGKKLLDLTATQQQAEDKLVEVYKKRMGATEGAAKATMELASAIQKQGVIGDEVTLSGAQQLATYAQYPETINKLLPAMDNLLVQQKGLNATADDATSIANLFGKAMMGQTGALKRVGISFTDAQEEVLKYGTEEEKAAMLAEVVTQNVGDMNEVFAQTDAGKIQQVKNSLGDFGEQLGSLLLPHLADLADKLNTKVLPVIEKIIKYLEDHPVIAKVIVAIAAFMAVAGPLLMILGSIASGIGAIMTLAPVLGSALAAVAGPVGIAILAITTLIAIGVALYRNWDTIKKKASEIWSAVKETIGEVVQGIEEWFNHLKLAVGMRFNEIKKTVSSTIQSIKDWFKNLQTAIGMRVNKIHDKISEVFTSIKNAMLAPIRKAVEVIEGLVDKIKGFFNFKVSLPHIKLPHFSIDPPGWKLSDLLEGIIPSLGIKWYAKGGIFDRPTVAGLGDVRGGEAAVPLDPFWKRMDRIVDAVENQDHGSTTINIYASEGMNVKQLALEVEKVLVRQQQQKKRAFA